MSRKFKIILLLAVLMLQITVLSHFKILSVVPNYIFVCIIAIAFISADSESVVIATVTGFITDLFTGAPLGLNTLLCMYISIGCVIISDSIYNKSIKWLGPLCFMVSFVYELLFGIISTLMRNVAFNPITIITIVLPVALLNTIFFIPCYILLKNVRSEKRRKGIKYEQ